MNNVVELLGYYGGDETHAQSAWTSTSRDLSGKRDRIPQLLKMLADNGHETPFEKSTLHFLVTTDIATHIHLLKHRIGVSINAESARYKELKEDKAYIPLDWPVECQDELLAHCLESFKKYHAMVEKLTPKLGKKRAKESARFFLPYANQITADVSFNFRSFVHFLKLRYSKHAQAEVRDVAFRMLNATVNFTDNMFEHSLKAFGLVSEDDKGLLWIRPEFE